MCNCILPTSYTEVFLLSSPNSLPLPFTFLQIPLGVSSVGRTKAQEPDCPGSSSVFALAHRGPSANYFTFPILVCKVQIIQNLPHKVMWIIKGGKKQLNKGKPLHGICYMEVLKNVSHCYLHCDNRCYCYCSVRGWLRRPASPNYAFCPPTSPSWDQFCFIFPWNFLIESPAPSLG